MPPTDEPSTMAKAMQWVSRIFTVSLEMVLPGIAGVLADRYLGTVVVFTLIGFALGFTAAGWHLMAMTRPPSETSSRPVSKTTDSKTES